MYNFQQKINNWKTFLLPIYTYSILIKVTLERAVQVLQACDDETTTVFENETLTMAMGLITSVLSGGLKVYYDRNSLTFFMI